MSTLAPDAVSERERLTIIIGVLAAMLLAALDSTIVAPAIPTIGAELGDAGYLSWIVSAYFLTSTAVTPLYGKLADIHGRRPVLFASVGIFVLGSILCAMAPSMLTLVAGRAVQGLGGGGLIALAQTVIGDLVPPKERGRYIVYISGTWATASVAGPVLGGLIAGYLDWRYIFWLNLPIAAVGIAMTARPLRRLRTPRRDHRLDVLGAVLLVAATTSLMLALTWGGAGEAAALSPLVLSLAGASLLLALLLWRHLVRIAEPLIPLEVLRNPVVLTASLSVFFSMAAFVGLSLNLPLYLELVLGLDAGMAGIALVGFMGGTVVGANYAARRMQRLTHYKRVPVLGLLIAILGTAVFAAFAGSLDWIATGLLMAAIGIGSGTLWPVTTVSLQNAVEPQDLGVATGALGFLRALGAAIGVAVIGAIATASGIVHELGVASAAATRLDGAAFTPVLIAAAVAFVLSLITLLAMEERPLRGRAPAPAEQA